MFGDVDALLLCILEFKQELDAMAELNQRPERAAGSQRLEQSLRPCFQHRGFPKLQGVFWPGNGKFNHRQVKKNQSALQ